jgi:hypothetical protein
MIWTTPLHNSSFSGSNVKRQAFQISRRSPRRANPMGYKLSLSSLWMGSLQTAKPADDRKAGKTRDNVLQVMEEIIAKSKAGKAEKRMAPENEVDETMALDKQLSIVS